MKYEDFVVKGGNIGKTHRTMDDAFKTADYATPIWKCETENERAVSMVAYVLVVVFGLLLLASIVYPAFNRYLGG
jgi:hypothetical protein